MNSFKRNNKEFKDSFVDLDVSETIEYERKILKD